MRATAKRLVERALCGSGVARAARAVRTRGTVVLAYHNIVPDGERIRGDRSLHLPRRDFARQLDLLARTHDVVPLAELGGARGTASRHRPRAVITFDDAYRGAVTTGVAELARRGLPATIFVAPALVGGRSFWWDALADAGRGAPEAVRTHCVEVLAGRDDAVRRWAMTRGWVARAAPAWQTTATEGELRAAATTPGITLGSHSWSHANVARLAMPALDAELSMSLVWLRERFDVTVPWLAYPYGRATASARAAAARAGYAGAFLIGSGRVTAGALSSRRHALPRVNVPAGLSVDGFELRVSGIR